MSGPDDDQLEVVADSSCPHCVILQMSRVLIRDGAYSTTDMARYTYQALTDPLLAIEPNLRDALMRQMIASLPAAVGSLEPTPAPIDPYTKPYNTKH